MLPVAAALLRDGPPPSRSSSSSHRLPPVASLLRPRILRCCQAAVSQARSSSVQHRQRMTKQVSWRQRVPKVREEEGQIVEPAPLALASPLLVAENLRDRGDDGQQELPTRKPAPVRKKYQARHTEGTYGEGGEAPGPRKPILAAIRRARCTTVRHLRRFRRPSRGAQSKVPQVREASGWQRYFHYQGNSRGKALAASCSRTPEVPKHAKSTKCRATCLD